MLRDFMALPPTTQQMVADFIDAGRGIGEAIGYFQGRERSTRLAVSVVTQMELIVDCGLP